MNANSKNYKICSSELRYSEFEILFWSTNRSSVHFLHRFPSCGLSSSFPEAKTKFYKLRSVVPSYTGGGNFFSTKISQCSASFQFTGTFQVGFWFPWTQMCVREIIQLFLHFLSWNVLLTSMALQMSNISKYVLISLKWTFKEFEIFFNNKYKYLHIPWKNGIKLAPLQFT